MAENPLLPNRKLQELYTQLEHCALLDKPAGRGAARRPAHLSGREALLAAMAIHLEPGDLLSPSAGDITAASLAPEPLRRHPASTGVWPLPAGAPRLYLQAAAAAALKSCGDRLTACLVESSQAEDGWAEAFSWAQHELLPMVFLCADRTGQKAMRPGRGRSAGKSRMTWQAVESAARKVQLPIITVDGQDAVAVYRAMQESALRARMGGGPALIWAILPAPSETVRPSAKPLARLKKYLSVRNIALPV